MIIVLVGSMIFLDKMSALKSKLENMGQSVVMPKLTAEELATGKDTFTEYLHSIGGVENISPDNDIWRIKKDGMMMYI